MNKIIKLPVYGITLSLVPNAHAGDGVGGTITSDFHENPAEVNPALDAVESMILAHAVAGVDIESPAYLEGIETALDAIYNH